METNAAFEEIWHRYGDFSFEEKRKLNQDDPLPECDYAQAFRQFGQEVCHNALQQPSHVGIAQALWQVTRRYWEFYYVVPKRHRYQIGDRGHRCIHAVFQEFNELLMRAELTLPRPMLFIPEPPPPPPAQITKVYAYPGFQIGEQVIQEDEADKEDE